MTDRYRTQQQLKAACMALHQNQQDLEGKLTCCSKGKEIIEAVIDTYDKECHRDCRHLVPKDQTQEQLAYHKRR